MNRKLNPGEMKWCLSFCIVVIFITTLPYLIGYYTAGENWVFSGFVFGVEDGNSYIAKMLMGATGDWLFRTPYTALPQGGMIAFLPYLLLGKLSASPGQHEQMIALFQIFRWGGIIAYVLATYQFLSIFIEKITLRRWGTAVISLGGGLGWLVILGIKGLWQNDLPLEFYSPETFGFLSIYGLPHLAFARAFLLWGLGSYLSGFWPNDGWSSGIKAGLFWLGVGIMQPLTVITAWAVIAAHGITLVLVAIISKKTKDLIPIIARILRVAIPAIGISAVVVIYNFAVFQFDPTYKLWQAQNKIFSPPVWDYLLAFGWALVFSILASIKIVQKQDPKALLLVGWLAVFPILAYAPYNLQRRLPEGIWVAVIALLLIQVQDLTGKTQKRVLPLFVLSFLPMVILLAGSVMNVIHPGLPLFRNAVEVKGFEYLARTAQKNDVVLAQFDASNALPAWAPVRVITGHGPESADIEINQPVIDRLFSTNDCSIEKIEFLNRFKVRYVIIEPGEAFFTGGESACETRLELIFMENDFRIYRVSEEPLSQ